MMLYAERLRESERVLCTVIWIRARTRPYFCCSTILVFEVRRTSAFRDFRGLSAERANTRF